MVTVALAGVTVMDASGPGSMVTGFEPIDPPSLPSPEYWALTWSTPAAPGVNVQLAVSGEPADSPWLAQPAIWPRLSEKLTVPVGVPAPGGLGATVAVTVIGVPSVPVAGVADTEVVVASMPTVAAAEPVEVA